MNNIYLIKLIKCLVFIPKFFLNIKLNIEHPIILILLLFFKYKVKEKLNKTYIYISNIYITL